MQMCCCALKVTIAVSAWGVSLLVMAMQVALDGQIVSGEANVSTEHITGEAVPSRKGPGDELPSGARVEDGALVVQASRPASESTIARIAQLSRQAKVRNIS